MEIGLKSDDLSKIARQDDDLNALWPGTAPFRHWPAQPGRKRDDRMSDYLETRDDAALDLLISRLSSAEKLNASQTAMLTDAQRILAERSAAKVSPHFDLPRAIAFLSRVAKERRLCSYKDLAEACITDTSAEWNTYYRKLGGPNGLMQSIIRHCAANGLPQFSSLVVRQSEVDAGPDTVPNRDGEAEYGFTRGMVDEGLARQGATVAEIVRDARAACFDWAAQTS